MSRIRGTAESVHFEADEDGFHLIVETNAGEFDFRVHGCLLDLAESYRQMIAPYLAERDAARSYVPGVTPEDLDAYEMGDPKRITLEREMNR